MSSYDQNLLASAPSISRKQKQDSYNIALLQSTNIDVTPTTFENTPLAANIGSPHDATLPSKEDFASYSTKPRFPWYRSKKLLIALISIIALAAIIGGAVGGVVGHRSKPSSALAGSPPTTSASDSRTRVATVDTSLPPSYSFPPTTGPTTSVESSDAQPGGASATAKESQSNLSGIPGGDSPSDSNGASETSVVPTTISSTLLPVQGPNTQRLRPGRISEEPAMFTIASM
ncbi:hypothetical protein BDW22DRAFT_1425657 [Trametopsis cervina]|nr:hypothetical protein BDW22DRAFT_1425657 [Trametopsis cervina]